MKRTKLGVIGVKNNIFNLDPVVVGSKTPVKDLTMNKVLMLKKILAAGKFIDQVVTGNVPLVLSDAAVKSIVSLTRYGLCTQDGTPTPADPAPIKCNNGTLTAVDDDLPTGYKRVQGFSVNDDCYWRLTDFKLNGSDTLRFAFSVTAACNVIGAYSGSASGSNLSLYVAVSGTGKYLRYKDGAYNSVIDTGTRYDVAITPTGSVGMKTDSTWDELSFTTTTDFCIGTTSTSTSSAKLKGSLFGNIAVDGRLDLVPCERTSDGVLGYYDLVGEAFYAPTSGIPTSLGYDYDHVHIEAIGTPEVLSVSGKNLNGGTIEHIGFTSTGASSTSDTFAGTGAIIPCVTGEKYTVSFGGFTTSGISGVFVNTWKTDGTFNLRQAISSTGETTFTIPDGVNKVNFTLYKTGGATIDSTSWMQVERGASATPYEPYVEPQTASVPMLLSVGDVKDEVELIHGPLTRRVTACLYDGTQPVGDVYMSTTGGKDAGAIIVYPLATPTTEQITAQNLVTNEGTNIVDSVANVSPVGLEIVYKKKK